MASYFKNILQKGSIFALFLFLCISPMIASTGIQSSEIVVVEETGGGDNASPQIDEEHVPLALQEPHVFESDYGESKIAKRMTQAEKNRNAAENDGWGGAITIIAMCIVIAALVVLSVLFLIFGKVSEAILKAKKKKAKTEARHFPTGKQELASGEVIAAISLALADYLGDKHDVEDTHITIRRLQKAYSPWNSKIYNLRPNLDHKRNI